MQLTSLALSQGTHGHPMPERCGHPSIALRALTAVVAMMAVGTAVVGVVGLIAFVIPTLTGDASIYESGRISGVPVGSGEVIQAPTAKNVAERLDLPGTDNLGRLAIEGEGVTVETNASFLDARMVYDDAPMELRIVVVTADVLRYLLATAALMVIWKLVRSARIGDPFHAASPHRIRTLGIIALSSWLTTQLFDAIRSAVRPSRTEITGHTFLADNNTSATWLVVAVALFALSEVFAHGRALQVTEDETV